MIQSFHLVTFLICLVCRSFFIKQYLFTVIEQQRRPKNLGIEDIQANTKTQQLGAKLDRDVIHNNNSSRQKTINKGRKKKRGGTKQTLLLTFSVRFKDILEEVQEKQKAEKQGTLE